MKETLVGGGTVFGFFVFCWIVGVFCCGPDEDFGMQLATGVMLTLLTAVFGGVLLVFSWFIGGSILGTL